MLLLIAGAAVVLIVVLVALARKGHKVDPNGKHVLITGTQLGSLILAK